MALRTSVGRAAFAGSVSQIVGLALSLITTPVLLHSLGLTAYGALAVISSLTGYIGVFDLGIGASLGRYMIVYRETGNHRAVAGVSSFAFLFYGVMLAILLPLIILTAHAIGRFLRFPPSLAAELPTLLSVILGLFITSNLNGLLGARLSSLQRLDVVAYASMCGAVASSIALIVFVPLHPDLYVVFACNFVQVIVSGLIMAAAIVRLAGEPPLTFGRIAWSETRDLFSFGLWTQLSAVTAIVNLEADKTIISRVLGVADVSPYQVANRIALLNRILPLQIITALAPSVTARISRGMTPEELERVYGSSSRSLMLATLLISGFVAAAADSLLRFWIGVRLPWAAELCAALIMSYVVNNATGVGTTIAKAEGRPQLETAYGIISALLNIGFTIALIARYGLVGVVGGTIAGNVIGSTFFIVMFHRLYHFPWWKTMGRWLLKLTVMTGSAAATALALLQALNGPSVTARLALLPGIIASGLAYLVVFGLVGYAVRFWEHGEYRKVADAVGRLSALRYRTR